MTTTGPASELTLRDGVLTCGAWQPHAQGVVDQPDEAVSLLLDGHAVTVTPRIVAAVTKTIQMVQTEKGTR